MDYDLLLKQALDFKVLANVKKESSSTNLGKALRSGEDLSIVEFSRKIRNADYSKWEEGQRLPVGMARVDIDSRPLGKHDCVFKNHDYLINDKEKLTPGVSIYTKLNRKK